MDILTVHQQQNWTFNLCSQTYDTLYFWMDFVLLLFSFPTTIAVILILLKKIYKVKSFSPAEIFLLQINITDMLFFIHLLLHFLNIVELNHFTMTISYMLYIPSFTARSIFLLAICVIFYFAIVHPVTYMTAKTWQHWEWLVIILGWLYAVAIDVTIVIYEIAITNPVLNVFVYIIILPIVFFNIFTLKALISSGPGSGEKTLNPAKMKAFRIILSILVVLLLYYLPQFFYCFYPNIAPADKYRFMCNEGLAVMMLPQFSEFAMPVIFLYSLTKLGI